MDSWQHVLADLYGDRLAALKRQAFLLCGDQSLAEDLVQEAVVRAFARPMRTPGRRGAEAYVRTIMLNLFIDGRRRQSRWETAAPLLQHAEAAPDLADRVATRDAVLGALADLSARQRACVVLRYYQDMPVAEIAATLGIAEGTAKRYLSEAIAVLACRLSGTGASNLEGST